MDTSDEQAFSFAMDLALGSVLPMALRTALELDLLEKIRKAGPEAPISASELAAQLPTTNSNAGTMIDRILRLLAAASVVDCRVVALLDGGAERRYSLTPACRFLTKNEDGVSLGPLSLSIQDRIFMDSWYHLKDAILDGGVAFDRAHGMNAFEYPATDLRFNKVFNQAMYNQTTLVMTKILDTYQGFEGLKSLVDVGGGIGATLRMITAKYPSINGINFDLHHVLQDAPYYPVKWYESSAAGKFSAGGSLSPSGVKHVSGDMFVSVPKADAIFMKWICHDWSDEHCQKLLKNCYESLPDDGKVIIADAIMGEEPNGGVELKYAARFDVAMLAFNPGGKERSEKEFNKLAKQAGFKEMKKPVTPM